MNSSEAGLRTDGLLKLLEHKTEAERLNNKRKTRDETEDEVKNSLENDRKRDRNRKRNEKLIIENSLMFPTQREKEVRRLISSLTPCIWLLEYEVP